MNSRGKLSSKKEFPQSLALFQKLSTALFLFFVTRGDAKI